MDTNDLIEYLMPGVPSGAEVVLAKTPPGTAARLKT